MDVYAGNDKLCGDFVHNIALLHLRAEHVDWVVSKALCKEALMIRTNVLPRNHPKIAQSMILLGLVHMHYRFLPKALDCFMVALKIYETNHTMYEQEVCAGKKRVLSYRTISYFIFSKKDSSEFHR